MKWNERKWSLLYLKISETQRTNAITLITIWTNLMTPFTTPTWQLIGLSITSKWQQQKKNRSNQSNKTKIILLIENIITWHRWNAIHCKVDDKLDNDWEFLHVLHILYKSNDDILQRKKNRHNSTYFTKWFCCE